MEENNLNQNHSYNILQGIAYKLSGQVVDIVKKYDKKNCTNRTEAEAISQCMLQMGCEKMMSVVSLLDKGINIVEDGKSLNIPSIFSQYPIVRSLYELMLIHHSLFVNPKSTHEFNVLLDLWKLKGYKLRTKYKNVHEHQEQQQREIKETETILHRIEQCPIYQRCKQQLEHAFATDKVGYFEFTTKNNKLSFTTTSFSEKTLFSRVFKELNGMTQMDNDMVYNLLSMNSHPTYLSVVQFGTQSSMNIEQQVLPLKSTTLFVLRMIKSHEFLLKNPIFQDPQIH